MGTYIFQIEVDEEKLSKIFDRLEKAREEIWNCYNELNDLGVIKLHSTASGN